MSTEKSRDRKDIRQSEWIRWKETCETLSATSRYKGPQMKTIYTKRLKASSSGLHSKNGVALDVM